MSDRTIHCVVITLEHAQARQDRIATRLRSLGIPFEFVLGVDGNQLEVSSHPNYDGFRRRIFFGRDLTKGELGCALAHRKVCRNALESGHAATLVLEDDAIPTDDLPRVLEDLMAMPERWDMVRFLGRSKDYRLSRLIVPLPSSKAMLARPLAVLSGTYGYLINLRAARRLVDLTERIWLPIDTLHGMTWQTGLKTLSVVPSPVLHDEETPSNIDGLEGYRRRDKSVTLTKGWRLAYPFTRAMHKLRFGVMSRWMRLVTLLPDLLIRLRSR